MPTPNTIDKIQLLEDQIRLLGLSVGDEIRIHLSHPCKDALQSPHFLVQGYLRIEENGYRFIADSDDSTHIDGRKYLRDCFDKGVDVAIVFKGHRYWLKLAAWKPYKGALATTLEREEV